MFILLYDLFFNEIFIFFFHNTFSMKNFQIILKFFKNKDLMFDNIVGFSYWEDLIDIKINPSQFQVCSRFFCLKITKIEKIFVELGSNGPSRARQV